ncbi:recombinase family protein [Faecalimonas sp.]
MAAQVSHLTKITAATPQWLLVDLYMDISTNKTSSSRKEFNRMLDDCTAHKLDIIFTKSISRFGRDTVAIIEALSKLKNCNI